MTRNFNFFLLLTFILAAQLMLGFQMQPLSVSCDNTTINVATTYTIVITRTYDATGIPTAWDTQPVPAGSNLTIVFPSGYNTAYGYTLQANGTTYPFVQSGQNITITSLFSTNTALDSLTLLIGNVLNPTPAITTDEFLCYVGSDYTNLTTDNFASVTLTPGSFKSCSITFSPTTVNKTGSSMQVAVTIQNDVPAGSSVLVTMPSLGYWFYDIAKQSFPTKTSMTCANISSNINQVITCVGGVASSTAKTVSASGMFSTSLASGSSFSFGIASMLSPPTVTSTRDAITISTVTSGSLLDTCSISVTGLTAQSLSVSIGPSSQTASITVNQNTTLRFSVVLPDVMNNGDAVSITFPSGSKIFSPSISGQISFGAGTTVGSTVTFSMISVRNLTSGYILNFTFFTYTAPSSTKATLPFTLNVLRDGNVKMTGTATLQASMSSLSFTVSQASSVVNANTTYTFTLVIGDQILSSGRIIIIFPAGLSQLWTSSACAQLTGTGVTTTATCTLSSATTLILTNLNSSSSNIPAQSLVISVYGISNPSSTQPSGTFNVTTYYSSTDDTSVSTGAMGSITATPASLNNSNVQITPSSYVVKDSNVAYTVSFLTTNAIPVGGSVMLGIPYSIQTAITLMGGVCYGATSGSLGSVTCSGVNNTSSNMYEITFTNLFASQGVAAGANITLKVTSIFTNPVSTDAVGSFSLTTYTSGGYMIDRTNSGLTVAMTTPADFSSVSINPASKVNSAVTSYTFTLAQPSAFSSGSKLDIIFPTEIVPQSSTSCTDGASSTLTCTVSSQTVTVSLPATVANNNFSVSVATVKNYFSLKPSGRFGFATRSSVGGYYSQNLSSITVANNVPSAFSSLSATFSPQELSSTLTTSITFQSSNTISSLTLSFASTFLVGTLGCSLSFSGSCTTSSNTVTINSISGPASMVFSISGLTSPKAVPTDYSTLTSYDSNSYIIDQSTDKIIFILNCTMPCRTCSSTTSTCTACYNDSTITTSNYFNSGTSKCVDACETGYFADSSQMKCNQCSSVCLTCQILSTNCTSCNSTSSFPYLNKTGTAGTCLSTCQSGMYADTNQSPTLCVNCVGPCVTCTSQTACLSCTSGTYLYLTSCLATCPPNISVLNSALSLCQACDAVCATCSVTSSNCTACANGTAYYNFNCVSSCPSGMVIQSNTCVNCDTPCSTCSNSSNNCTACDSSTSTPHFLNNSCYSSCPQRYYNDSATGSCLLCSLLSLNCDICYNSTACVSCNTGYIFFSNTCLLTAPPGYVNISGQALPCTGDCGTCSVLQSNCTSCKTLNFLNYQCLASCPTTYAPVSGICTACSSPCLTCSQTITNCTTCVATLSPAVFLSNGLCITTCPTGSYANTADHTCASCVAPCLTCTALSLCSTCTTGNYLYQPSSSCVTTCPQRYYNDSATGSCLLCSLLSLNCDICYNSTACVSCNTGYIFFSNTCLLTAPPGYVNISGQALPCTGDCGTCSVLQSNCTSCKTLNFLNYQCLASCPTTYAPVSGICTACSSPCLTCSQTITNCTTCVATLSPAVFLSNGLCITTCPTGSYANTADHTCASCVAPCLTCTALSLCSTCTTGNYLYQPSSSCVTTCPAGFAALAGICTACQSPCRTCTTSPTVCESCLANLTPAVFLAGTDCVLSTNCPTMTYANQTNNECVSCVPPCQTCTSSTTCTTCIADYNIHLGICYSSCLIGYTPINSVCTICTYPCLTCAGTTTTCLSCNQTTTSYYLRNNYCITSCPATKYGNAVTYECLPCATPCYTCNTSTSCFTCMAGYFLYVSTCLSSCPTGYVGIVTTCLTCAANCHSCYNTTTVCTNCNSGYYLLAASNYCVTTCPAPLFPNSLTASCTGCQSPCSTCTGSASNCTACSTGFLYGNTCIDPCPDGYYAANGTYCAACGSGCANCTSPTICTTCLGAYYLSYQQCVSSCPTAFPVIKNNSCTACSYPFCSVCDNTDKCHKCNSPYLLYNASCVSSCPTGYQSDGLACNSNTTNNTDNTNNTTNTTNNTTTQTLNNTLVGSKMFPVPFTIGGVVVAILCGVSKFNSPNTFASAAAYSLLGLLEWGALGTLSLLYYLDVQKLDIVMYAIFGIAGAIYLLNIATLLAMLIIYRRDKHFEAWLQCGHRTKASYSVTVVLSTLCSHKMANILFSRLFALFVFRAQLDTVKGFFTLHLISFLSFVPSLSAVGLASYICYNNMASPNQIFLQGLDVIVLGVVNSVMAISNSQKSDDFFEEKEGYLTLNKRNVDSYSIMADEMFPDGTFEENQINIGRREFDSVHSDSNNSTHTILDPMLYHSNIENSLSITLKEEGKVEKRVGLSRSSKRPSSKTSGKVYNMREDDNTYNRVFQLAKTFHDVSIQAYDILELDGEHFPESSDRSVQYYRPYNHVSTTDKDIQTQYTRNNKYKVKYNPLITNLSTEPDKKGSAGNYLPIEEETPVKLRYRGSEKMLKLPLYHAHEKNVLSEMDEEALPPHRPIRLPPSFDSVVGVNHSQPESSLGALEDQCKLRNDISLPREHSATDSRHGDVEDTSKESAKHLNKSNHRNIAYLENQYGIVEGWKRLEDSEKSRSDRSESNGENLRNLKYNFEQLNKQEIVRNSQQSNFTFCKDEYLREASRLSEYGLKQIMSLKSQLTPSEYPKLQQNEILADLMYPKEQSEVHNPHSNHLDKHYYLRKESLLGTETQHLVYQIVSDSPPKEPAVEHKSEQQQEKNQSPMQAPTQNILDNSRQSEYYDVRRRLKFSYGRTNQKEGGRFYGDSERLSDGSGSLEEIDINHHKKDNLNPITKTEQTHLNQPEQEHPQQKKHEIINHSQEAPSISDFNSSKGSSAISNLTPVQLKIYEKKNQRQNKDYRSQQLIIENDNIDESFQYPEDDLYKHPISRLSPPKKELSSITQKNPGLSYGIKLNGQPAFGNGLSKTIHLIRPDQARYFEDDIEEVQQAPNKKTVSINLSHLKQPKQLKTKETRPTVFIEDSQLSEYSVDPLDFPRHSNTLMHTDNDPFERIQHHMRKNQKAPLVYYTGLELDPVDTIDASKSVSSHRNNHRQYHSPTEPVHRRIQPSKKYQKPSNLIVKDRTDKLSNYEEAYDGRYTEQHIRRPRYIKPSKEQRVNPQQLDTTKNRVGKIDITFGDPQNISRQGSKLKDQKSNPDLERIYLRPYERPRNKN